MKKWSRFYKTADKQIYVYLKNEDPDTYKVHAYGLSRYYQGEDAVQELVKLVRDLGDCYLNESLIKKIKKEFVGA
jgi:hypothetical protein